MKGLRNILIAFGVIVFISCSKQPATKEVEAGLTYYFYPKANVYFDTTASNYIFLGEDGSWQTNIKLPADKQSLLEKNIVINNPELPVWKNNDAHQLLYSATLYSTAEDFKEEDKIAVTKKELPLGKAEEKDKDQKKGIGKFFNKIFKGKKNKQEEKDTDKSETTKSIPIP